MDTRKLKTNKVNVLNKILELGNLTNSQRLYLNYADYIGLDVNWLNEHVIFENNTYKINGLIWKYKYICLEDDVINNKLLIELKYIEKHVSPEERKKIQQYQQGISNLYVPLISSYNGYYVSSGTSLNNIQADQYNLLTEEYLLNTLDGQIENPKIKNSSEYGIKIVELETFIKYYKFESSEFKMPQTINKPTFKLIIE